jgi:hypothetical protein
MRGNGPQTSNGNYGQFWQGGVGGGGAGGGAGGATKATLPVKAGPGGSGLASARRIREAQSFNGGSGRVIRQGRPDR